MSKPFANRKSPNNPFAAFNDRIASIYLKEAEVRKAQPTDLSAASRQVTAAKVSFC